MNLQTRRDTKNICWIVFLWTATEGATKPLKRNILRLFEILNLIAKLVERTHSNQGTRVRIEFRLLHHAMWFGIFFRFFCMVKLSWILCRIKWLNLSNVGEARAMSKLTLEEGDTPQMCTAADHLEGVPLKKSNNASTGTFDKFVASWICLRLFQYELLELSRSTKFLNNG